MNNVASMLLQDHPHFMWKISGLTLLLTLQIAAINVRMKMVIHGTHHLPCTNRPPPNIQPKLNQPSTLHLPSSLTESSPPSIMQTIRKAQPPMSPLRTSSKQDSTSRASHHRTHPLSVSHHSSPSADQSSPLSITSTNTIQN